MAAMCGAESALISEYLVTRFAECLGHERVHRRQLTIDEPADEDRAAGVIVNLVQGGFKALVVPELRADQRRDGFTDIAVTRDVFDTLDDHAGAPLLQSKADGQSLTVCQKNA